MAARKSDVTAATALFAGLRPGTPAPALPAATGPENGVAGQSRAAAPRLLSGILREVRIADIDIDEKQVRQGQLRNIDKLAASLREIGLVEPIIVERQPDGRRWRLTAGFRRVAAATSIGWTSIAALERGSMDDRERLVLRLVENIQRDGMTREERVAAYRLLRDLNDGDYKKAAEQLGILPTSFLRAVQERAEGEGAAAARISVGQLTKALDRWIETPGRLDEAKREELLVRARALVAALEAQ